MMMPHEPAHSADGMPLAGIRVLELGHYIAGPAACAQLADMGAEVIKVEPPSGDPARNSFPYDEHGESLYFATYNHRKRSISLDLKDQEGTRILPSLLRWADVLVTNYAVGVPERLGFGYDQAKRLNPGIVMVHVTGFGSWSGIASYAAVDPIVQAMSGLAAMTGEPDRPPTISSIFYADLVASMQATTAVVAALVLRERTGRGSFVEVSMMRALAPLLADHVPKSIVGPDQPRRIGNKQSRRFINLFETSDGHVILCPMNSDQWTAFCEIIGRPDLGSPDAFEKRLNVLDLDLREELEGATRSWASRLTSGQAMAELQSAGVPAGPTWEVDEVIEADRRYDFRLLKSVQLLNGTRVQVPRSAFEWQPSTPDSQLRVCAIDEHRESILSEIGALSAPELDSEI